jgi:hypothetical protein
MTTVTLGGTTHAVASASTAARSDTLRIAALALMARILLGSRFGAETQLWPPSCGVRPDKTRSPRPCSLVVPLRLWQ